MQGIATRLCGGVGSLSAPYESLGEALTLWNERGKEAELAVHQAVIAIVRQQRHKLPSFTDLQDVCQEVEIAIAMQMRSANRLVLDVVRQVPVIVDRKIADQRGRSKIRRLTLLLDDEGWEKIGSSALMNDETLQDAEATAVLEGLEELSERERVAVSAFYKTQDMEAVREALERQLGEPVSRSAAKQTLYRARDRMKKILDGGRLP